MSKTSSAQDQAKEIKRLLQLGQGSSKQESLTSNEDASRLDSIRRIFQKLVPEMQLHLDPTRQNNASPAQIKWEAWLKKHHDIFLDQLCQRIRPQKLKHDNGNAGKRYALRVFFGVMAYMSTSREGYSLSKKARFIDENIMFRLMSAFCGADVTDDDIASVGNIDNGMLQMLETEFILAYHDVRYFMLVALMRLANQVRIRNDAHVVQYSSTVVDNIVRCALVIDIAKDQEELSNAVEADTFLVTPPKDDENYESISSDDEDEESDDESDIEETLNENGKRKQTEKNYPKKRRSGISFIQRISRYRRILGNMWLSLLQLSDIPPKTQRKVLQFLSTDVIPNMHTPLQLADYFTLSYDYGGVTSLLALNGLFVLMTEYGLEYPKFFTSLYALINIQAFYAKHRVRFFKLLSTCLSFSHMLPSYIVAAFIKRLTRCALSAPPSGALFVLALVSNLMRKHKSCRTLVCKDESNENIEDFFDAETDVPEDCRALESSLWELESLEKHYHPTVASFARVVGTESDKTPLYDLDDFLVHTYKSLFDTETNEKKLKKSQVPLAFKEPSGLFTENDIFQELLSI